MINCCTSSMMIDQITLYGDVKYLDTASYKQDMIKITTFFNPTKERTCLGTSIIHTPLSLPPWVICTMFIMGCIDSAMKE